MLDQDPDTAKDPDRLWERVEAIWREIPMEYFHKMCESMLDRLAMVIRNKDATPSTDYRGRWKPCNGFDQLKKPIQWIFFPDADDDSTK